MGSAAFVGVLLPNDPFISVDFQLDSDFGDGGTGIDDVYVGFAVPEPAYPGSLLVVMGFLAARKSSQRDRRRGEPGRVAL